MKNITNPLLERLFSSGLTTAEALVFWAPGRAREGGYAGEFSELLASLQGSNPGRAFFFAKPAEPYWSMLNILAESAAVIQPDDSESKMLIGALPVIEPSDTETIATVWQGERTIAAPAFIIPTAGVIVSAPSLRQASVMFSAVCFAITVKFLVDIANQQSGAKLAAGGKAAQALALLINSAEHRQGQPSCLLKGVFNEARQAKKAMEQAGKSIVALGLVNASFGNISYTLGEELLISATGSFLDDLAGAIVSVPLRQKSCEDRLASSELPAHRKILVHGNARALLHGHPVFTVAMSLIGALADCGAPVVVGETGGGRYGLDKVLPKALMDNNIAVAHGHGVFCTGKTDFNEPLQAMLALENDCRREYLRLTAGIL